jgi:hypothetical protein
MKMVGVSGILRPTKGLRTNNQDKEMFDNNSKVKAVLLVSTLIRVSYKNDLGVLYISPDPR